MNNNQQNSPHCKQRYACYRRTIKKYIKSSQTSLLNKKFFSLLLNAVTETKLFNCPVAGSLFHNCLALNLRAFYHVLIEYGRDVNYFTVSIISINKIVCGKIVLEYSRQPRLIIDESQTNETGDVMQIDHA